MFRMVRSWFGLPQATLPCPSCGHAGTYFIPMEDIWEKVFTCESCSARFHVFVRNGLILSIHEVEPAE